MKKFATTQEFVDYMIKKAAYFAHKYEHGEVDIDYIMLFQRDIGHYVDFITKDHMPVVRNINMLMRMWELAQKEIP